MAMILIVVTFCPLRIGNQESICCPVIRCWVEISTWKHLIQMAVMIMIKIMMIEDQDNDDDFFLSLYFL